MNIPPLDLAILVVYLLGILVVGLLSVRRVKLSGEQYFLAGRTLRWPVVGAALFASNISTIHLVGLAEGGYQNGLVIGNFEWMASLTLILLALVFVPFYFRSRISTLPEYLEKRYGSGVRPIMAVMAIAAALFIHIGISLYAGAAIFEEFFGIDVQASIAVISLCTAIYTVAGGLRAVVVTETIQAVVLLGGAVTVTVLALRALPEAGVETWSDLQAATQPEQLHMLQSQHEGGLTWYGFLLGFPILGVWYWCSDQTIVQRVLGARDQGHAQRGALFAGLLKTLPVFLMVMPGVFGYALFRDEVGDDAKRILPVMVNELVPTGLRGLIAAGLLAALMSTIAAALNSVGTLVAVDIVGRARPGTSDRAQVRIGRISAVVVMLLSMAWSTQGGRFDSIFEAINKMPAQFLAPPISTVFVWGVFWKRGTREAALTTLVLGFGLGIVAFLLDLPAFGETQWITDAGHGLGISFLMQAFWGFCLCSVIFVITSLCTVAPPAEQTAETTWPNPLGVLFDGRLTGWSDPRVLGGLLFVLMMGLYWSFA